MKKILAGLIVTFLAAPAFAQDVYVKGYTKQNGAYVQPYHRTAPDNTPSNNYSTYPNTNPYTGKTGADYQSSPNNLNNGYTPGKRF